MDSHFKLNTVNLAIFVAFSVGFSNVFGAEPYPALPPTLSTSVTPNVMLHIDNSGSMADSAGGEVKMTVAKDVAKNLIANNSTLRWGIFSFDPQSGTATGGTDTRRREGGILRAPIGSSISTLNTTIDGFSALTSTPLGEAMFEMTRYFGGDGTYPPFKKAAITEPSPIQYRCQKNFAIVITDGVATKDNNLPGLTVGSTTNPAISYKSYNSAGTQVTRSFQVCHSTSTSNSYVTCPAKLEGSAVNNAFTGSIDDTASDNHARSLRDVAMYAYDRDFKVGGTDGDGKSWDDPKFPKQNLQTYTVGFAVDDPVLRATATVGGGAYYTASNRSALAASLQNAVNSIVSSISNAGGVATQSEITKAGNKAFQPIFSPNGWYGELRCLELGSDGSIGASCTNPKATIPAAGSRNIYSSKVVGMTTTSFAFNDSIGIAAMTNPQKTALATTPEQLVAQISGVDPTAAQIASRKATALGDTAGQKNTINFLRGTEGISGFRVRPVDGSGNKIYLGDIVDGQPVVVSAPSGSTNDASYSTFKSTNSSRNIVMVGANDGMLHAFDADTMGELAGYIPSAVYPHLRALTATDYGVSGGTSHTYHVNGGMRQQDIKVGGNWKTIVVGTLGQGGQGYYAVDATDVSKFLSAGAMVKWEWTDQNNALGGTANTSSAGLVGYAMNPPVIYNVRTSATTVVPAVIFSNGYQNGYDDTVSGGVKTASNSSHLFIVNADTGALIKRIDLPTTGSYKSEGLSAPAVVDVGQDGIADYVYAGDVNGNMWRFDLIDDNPINFKVGRNSTNDMVPIFQDPSKHPIVMRPGVMGVSKSDGTGIGNMVLFGTGQLLTDADRSDVDVQVLYGILDKSIMSDDIIAPITTVATLQQQSVVDTVTTTTNRIGTYRKVSTNYIDLKDSANTKDGWYIELPVLSERLVTSPLVFDDKVLFGTGIPKASEKCLPGGEGWVMGLNPLTGSVATKLNSSTGTAFSFIDINGDKKSSTADKLTFSSGSAYMSGYRKDGIPTELTYVSGVSTLTGPSDFSGTDPYSGAGSYIALREANSMAAFTGVGRTSISRGVVIKRLVSAGKGGLYGGTVGSTSLDKEDLTGPPTTAARVESTTWREIK